MRLHSDQPGCAKSDAGSLLLLQNRPTNTYTGHTLRSGVARLLLLLGLVAPAMADSASDAIKRKDGAAHAAQFEDAVRVNIRPELRTKLAPIVAAIRHAENGRAGREYGVLHPKALGKSYRTQAGWCAATVQKHYDRWTKAGSQGDFLQSLARRYCPVGAGNDPTGLNRHWGKNVRFWRDRIVKQEVQA